MLDADDVRPTVPPVKSAPIERRPLPRGVAREAAHWLMRHHSGELSEDERQACMRWRAAAPEHEAAWQRAQHLRRQLGLLPPGTGLAVLDRSHRPAHQGRRAMLKTLGVLLTGGPAGCLAWRKWETWGPDWTANHRTATGERREIMLADGSHVRLNTATAIDVDFSVGPGGKGGERLVRLHRGEILVTTGTDGGRTGDDHRPFVVETRHGRIRALGTRFLVRRTDAGAPAASMEKSMLIAATTRVSVQQGAVEIRPAAAQENTIVVQAGQQADFDTLSTATAKPLDPHADAWSRGLLFAHDQRLADFVAELGRHRAGLLRCAPEVADLRITGAFRLHDIDAVLAALPDTLPVDVVHRTRWWVSITPPRARQHD